MNLPNKLTLFRVFLVPIICFVWLFPYEQFNITIGYVNVKNVSLSYLNLIVLLLFCIAAFTDYLDGKIARKENIITTFGKFIDPVADKLLINMMFILMLSKHMIPVLPVVLIILRDIVVDGCRMIAAQKGIVVSAGFLGKLKTVLQMFTIIFVLLNNLPFELIRLPITDLMLWFTSFISVAGGVSYFMQVKDYIFESM